MGANLAKGWNLATTDVICLQTRKLTLNDFSIKLNCCAHSLIKAHIIRVGVAPGVESMKPLGRPGFF